MAEPVIGKCFEVKGQTAGKCYSSREETVCSRPSDCGSVYFCASSFKDFVSKYLGAANNFIAKGCNKFSIKIPQVAIKIPRTNVDIKIPATVNSDEKSSYTPANGSVKMKDCESGAGAIRCY